MNVKCPHCQSILDVPDQFRGKTAKCSLCGQAFTVAATQRKAGRSNAVIIALCAEAVLSVIFAILWIISINKVSALSTTNRNLCNKIEILSADLSSKNKETGYLTTQKELLEKEIDDFKLKNIMHGAKVSGESQNTLTEGKEFLIKKISMFSDICSVPAPMGKGVMWTLKPVDKIAKSAESFLTVKIPLDNVEYLGEEKIVVQDANWKNHEPIGFGFSPVSFYVMGHAVKISIQEGPANGKKRTPMHFTAVDEKNGLREIILMDPPKYYYLVYVVPEEQHQFTLTYKGKRTAIDAIDVAPVFAADMSQANH